MRILGTTEHTASKPAGKVANVLVAAALALGMSFGVGAQALAPEAAYAANNFNSPEKQSYTYTVRVYSGQQGTFTVDGKKANCVEMPGIAPGTNIPFNPGSVTLYDKDKYYVKGWKNAGKDDVRKGKTNNDSLLLSDVTVDRDMDLVVCYGVLVDAVGYTVRYVDQAGNELYPAETFRGNVGDSPVLAYRYIEGYLPQAYNLTGELYRNEADNVYTFTYTPLATPEDVTVTLPTVVTTTTVPAAGGAAAGGEAVPAADAPAVAVETPPAEELIADDGTPLAEPAQIEDIRDEETPMASLNSLSRGDTASEADIPLGEFPFLLGLGIGAFAVIAVAVALILIYRKKQHESVVNAARASIAAGNTVDPASIRDDVDINYVPLNNQAGYPDPAQYAPQSANTQQYAAPDYAQQYPAQYGTQQYGDMQYGDQFNGQYNQYDPQFGAQDDQ